MTTRNDQRAARFADLLRQYGTDDSLTVCLIYLLADARHWCDRVGLGFASHDRKAHDHYLSECWDMEEPVELPVAGRRLNSPFSRRAVTEAKP
jgi:hypothetical protein